MMELTLTLLVLLFFMSLILVIISGTAWCGPTWFQRTGFCFAILSIATGVFVSEIQPEMYVSIIKNFLENAVVIFTMIGALIGAFGELIWNVFHNKKLSFSEIMKKFVNT